MTSSGNERRFTSGTVRRCLVYLLIALSVSVASGCRQTVVYIRGAEEVMFIGEGEAAPHAGFLISPEVYAEITANLQLLEKKLDAETK